MGIKSKLKGLMAWRKKRAYAKHIISTHVEDVSMDLTGDTPRGDQKFAAQYAALDNKVLTQILDADHRVQIALKGWEMVEKEMGEKFAEDSPKVQSMTIGSTVVPTPRPQENMPSSLILDDISPHLRVEQRTNAGDVLEHNDFTSTDAEHICQASSRNQNLPSSAGLWVDFSDSSGSQMSRQSPGTNTTASPSHRTPFGWDLPLRSSTKTLSSGCTSMDFGMQTTEKPRGPAATSSSATSSMYSPFAAANRSLEQPQGTRNHQLACANSARARLRHSVTFPNHQPGPNASGREENVYSSCTSRDLPSDAWQSTLMGEASQLSDGLHRRRPQVLPSRSSWGAYSGKSFDGSMDQQQRLDLQRLSHNYKRQSVSPISASSDMQDAEVFMAPRVMKNGTRNRPARRMPPALRVRFTPEHLQDVLMHVGEAPRVTDLRQSPMY